MQFIYFFFKSLFDYELKDKFESQQDLWDIKLFEEHSIAELCSLWFSKYFNSIKLLNLSYIK